VQESFAPVYPDRGDSWIDESVRLEPVDFNRTVLDAEESARQFSASGHVGVTLRFAAFYGPDAMQATDYIRVLRWGWVPMPGERRAFISSVSHDDAATAVVAALGARSGEYNISDDEPLRHEEFFGSLASAIGARTPRFPPGWSTRLLGAVGELLARSLRISNRKFRAETGWAPRYPSAREGWVATLAEMAAR
jgi:nucleoside-diphosphate-sugar epimerase